MTHAFAPFDRPQTEELLLELLDMPISFHRCFVAITGKVTSALLLSYLWWSANDAGMESRDWIAMPLERIREDTGLSRDELSGARRSLRERGILDERRRGMPPVVEFHVDRARVAHLLMVRTSEQHATHDPALAQAFLPLNQSPH